jgi:hypothetical protein
MLRSEAYRALSVTARALIIEMQMVWTPDIADVHYSAERAGKALGVSKATAARAFNELVDAGFLVITGESYYSRGDNGRSRQYSLTWESMNGREPTSEYQTAKNSGLTHETVLPKASHP